MSNAAAGHRLHASIWLRLPPRPERHLQAVIARLAHAHGTHDFLPHLTVCGPTLEATTLAAASRRARESGQVPLRVRAAGISCALGNPFQAVFIEIAESPELRRFREQMRDITGADGLAPPHLSLLYAVDRGHAPIAFELGELEEIASQTRAAVAELEYVLERPAVAYPPGGNWLAVPEWRVEDL